jgi:hypothetical protein
MTGPKDPRISVYPSLHEDGMWTWTVTSSPGRRPCFAQIGHKPTEAAAWRQAENVLLACDPKPLVKAAA